MSLFGIKTTKERYGAIVDIGSGSVLIAIVQSSPSKPAPQVIWSHREHAPLKNIDSIEQSAKAVMTALITSGLLLDSDGRSALLQHNPQAKISEIQCAIAAPWSYTVTKTISYSQDKPFLVSEELLAELKQAAEDKVSSDLQENETLEELGLKIISRSVLGVTANGYHVKKPQGATAQEVTFSLSSSITQQYLIEALDDLRDKLIARADIRKLSFILMMFAVTRDLFPQKFDTCLIDVTYEATEIGIVRDGTLSYCTHTPFGVFSLAREIATVTNEPLHEIFARFRTEKPLAFIDTLTEAKQIEIKTILDAYIDKVADLFRETGDSLSIPKQITLHTDVEHESLFVDLIDRAAKKATRLNHAITPINKEIIRQSTVKASESTPQSVINDTALLLSAQFFHNQEQYRTFEFL